MFRLLAFFALILIPTMSSAGLRATYAARASGLKVIEIADNGDMRADLEGGRQLIVTGGSSYVVEDRLTGPVVTRLDDIAALARERIARASPASRMERLDLIQQGTADVGGRSGRVYVVAQFPEETRDRDALVLSDDRALAPLGRAFQLILSAQIHLIAVHRSSDGEGLQIELMESVLRLLDQGAPIQFFDWRLRRVEQLAIGPDIALPAEPETAAAYRARLAADAAEERLGHNQDQMISRAVFSAGRLFLLSDNGTLSSIGERERTRISHPVDGQVLDICRRGNSILALTGARDRASAWTVRAWENGQWRTERSIRRAGDALIALICTADSVLLLSDRRLLDLLQPDAAPLMLGASELRPLVNAVAYSTTDAVFVGINAGEWGGGLRRIDRRTGQITTIERNATGDLCDGPLNTGCDPVHGITAIPWRPGCIAAAIGLIHMAAHGRIVSVCPEGVEQLYSAADGVDETNARAVADAASGRYGSVAFFGLAFIDGQLVAAGHNGVHRLGRDGRAAHQRWPRFVEIDGMFVSFALPDVVLVLTRINGRASMSGAAPMLVPR